FSRAQWQQRNFDEAERAALKARSLDPANAAVSDLLIRIYFDLDQPDKFQAELERATTLDAPVQDLVIRFFLHQGQFARAYDARIRYEKAGLERSVLETQLALQRDPSQASLIPQLVRNLVKLS